MVLGLPLCCVYCIADNHTLGVGLTARSQRTIGTNVLMYEGYGFPSLGPIDEYLASRAIWFVLRTWQMAILPQPLEELPTLHSAYQVSCVKMIAHDSWFNPGNGGWPRNGGLCGRLTRHS